MIKLSDCELEVRPTHSESARSRLCYTAPELIEEKSDVWSLGVLLFKAMTGVFPFSGHCEEAIPKATDPLDILADSGIHSTELFDFLQKCLVKSVNERWSVSELMDVSASLQSDE